MEITVGMIILMEETKVPALGESNKRENKERLISNRAVACIIDMLQLTTPHGFLVYFTIFSCNLGVKMLGFH